MHQTGGTTMDRTERDATGKDLDDRILAYLQGRLEGAARQDFEAELAADAGLRAELAVMEGARRDFAAAAVPEGAREAGWARLAHSMAVTPQPVPANLNRWPGRIRTGALMAASVVVAVTLWQAAVVPRLADGGGAAFAPAGEAPEGPALKVQFAPGATLADVTALLQGLGARVTDGPGALGLYTLGFVDAAAQAAAEARLKSRPDLVATVARP